MWLHVPKSACSTLPAAPECWEMPSLERWQSLASNAVLHVTSSGQPKPQPASWRGWQRRAWVTRLSGTMLTRSTADRGVESWIASLRATRVNRSANPVADVGSGILATFGQRFIASSAKRCQASCSWRMSQGTFLSAGNEPYGSWRAWATALRRDCLRRRKSAHHTAGSGCSCSVNWPTPDAMGGGKIRRGGNRNGELLLQGAAQNWPTTRREDAENCGNHPGATDSLTRVTANWPTPQATDEKRDRMGIAAKRHYAGRSEASRELSIAACLWATPNARDHKGVNQHLASRGTLDQLPNQAEHWATTRLPETLTWRRLRKTWRGLDRQTRREQSQLLRWVVRERSSAIGRLLRVWTAPECPRLNPRFAEWLMGWPRDLTSYGLRGTEWTRWQQHMRSSLCGHVRCTMNQTWEDER